MGRAFRRASAVLLSTLLLTGFLVMQASSPAAARKVGNPGGAFTLRVHAGALSIGEEGFDFIDEGRLPQCSDGDNNDGSGADAQDELVDAADPQCAAGGAGQPKADDDSETQPGFQPKMPILLQNGTVSPNGDFTFPAANFSFPTQYLFVNADDASGGLVDDFIVTLQIIPLAAATGNVNPVTGAMTMNMSVRVSATGGPLSSGCGVNPINITGATTGSLGGARPMTGSPYDLGTGRMSLVQNSYSVPGASGCGTIAFVFNLNDQINSTLGLPSGAGNNTARFDAEWTPKRPTVGVEASFTATPSSGLAPLSSTMNASASTGAAPLTYQWDWTNDGSFDATGVSPTHVYQAGTHTTRLRVTDADGDQATTTRLITVGANLPPTANDQLVSTPEDTAKAITLTGSDPEGGALTYTRVAPNPANGSVVCAGAACTYTPNPNFHGTDTFGFRATDNLPGSDDGTVTVNVTPVNDVPTTSNVSAATTEDVPVGVNLVANDIDGDALTYEIVTAPTKGTLSGTAPNLTYTPNADENGPDAFTYRVVDAPSGAVSNTSTASISITAVNDAPVADDRVGVDAVAAAEDTPIGITVSGSDVDSSFTFGLVTPPAHGSLSGILPNLTYTPAANYNGPDSFVFRVTDPSAATDTGTVEIDVAAVNDAPVTTDRNLSAVEDTPVDITIVGTDVDGDPLTFTPSASSAEGGTISCAGAVCTYTPPSGYSGPDSFTVDVSDGTDTATSTVSVLVSALNNTQPIVNDATIVVLEDGTRSFNIPSTDADGDPRSLSVVSPPADGSLTCSTAGACTYVPVSNANGSRTFTVLVTDGRGGSDLADITLSIVPLNDAPVVAPQTLGTSEDTVGTLDLGGTDVDGDTLTWTVKSTPAKGSVSCTTAGACTYTPNANANGSDAFDVEANDGNGSRVRSTVTVSIAAVDDAPKAGTVTKSVTEDGSTTFNLVGTDVDGDAVTFAASPAVNGTLTCNASGSCSYATNANAVGTETVAYTVTAGASTVSGTIVVTIVPVNDAPVAISQTLTTPEDTPLAVTLLANDADQGDPLTFTVTSPVTGGTLSGAMPNLTYKPAPNASGSVSFGFSVRDQAGATSNGTVTILVTPVDDAPVAVSQSVTTAEDTAKAIALVGSDVEGPVTKAVTTPPAHGTYSTGSGVYTPATNYNGPDSIGFKVTDSAGQVTLGTIAIAVTPVNDPPVATDQNVTTTRAAAKPITLGATDVDGPGDVTYAILNPPTKGTLSGTAPNLTYTPNGFVTGSDVLTYKVTDSGGLTDSGTIAITITAGPALATQTVAAPATVTKPGGLLGGLQKYTYNNLSATVTTVGTNLPVAGVSVSFKVNGAAICTATTNSSGTATCSGKGARVNVPTYQASFAGNAGFAASTGNGALS